jgi:hypothetical protein
MAFQRILKAVSSRIMEPGHKLNTHLYPVPRFLTRGLLIKHRENFTFRQTDSGAHLASLSNWYWGLFPQGQSGRTLKLTYLRLLPRLSILMHGTHISTHLHLGQDGRNDVWLIIAINKGELTGTSVCAPHYRHGHR